MDRRAIRSFDNKSQQDEREEVSRRREGWGSSFNAISSHAANAMRVSLGQAVSEFGPRQQTQATPRITNLEGNKRSVEAMSTPRVTKFEGNKRAVETMARMERSRPQGLTNRSIQ